MLRALVCLLFGFLVAAATYAGTAAFLRIGLAEPFRSRAASPAWPLPDSSEPHPFWPRFPDLRSPKPERRDAALEALLALQPDRLPHPALKPRSWPLTLRIQAQALLWRLHRGKAYRVDGLQLRLGRASPEPVRAGEPAGLRLSLENVSASVQRARFLTDLDQLVRAGARIQVVTRPPRKLRLGPAAPPPDHPSPPERLRGVAPLAYAPLRQAAFTAPGEYAVVVAVDLNDARLPDLKLPAGILVSNTLRVRVEER